MPSTGCYDDVQKKAPKDSRPGSIGKVEPWKAVRAVPDFSGDTIVPVPDKFILFVELALVFPNGHCKPFLLKVRLLLFPHGSLFQDLGGEDWGKVGEGESVKRNPR